LLRLGAFVRHSEIRLKTINPENKLIANPIGLWSTTPGQRVLKTVENTRVYTASIKSGCRKDQKMPRREPRYLPKISLSDNLKINDYVEVYKEMLYDINNAYFATNTIISQIY
jgi:hypothetical protein